MACAVESVLCLTDFDVYFGCDLQGLSFREEQCSEHSRVLQPSAALTVGKGAQL